MRPLASLLAVAMTVATPAVLAACVALCMPGMRGHAMATVAADEASAAASASGCADHEATAPAASGDTVTASDVPCCVDRLTAAAPSVVVERVDTRPGLASMPTTVAVWTLAPPWRAGVRLAHPGGSSPPVLRRPSVLRI